MTLPRLVSYRLCPFVQRVAIALELKGSAYGLDYIDLADPPGWFQELSPLGRVPLLRVGNAVLFESAAITEYVDEVHPPRLHAEDPVQRARDRAWMALGEEALWDLFHLSVAADGEAFDTALAALHRRLDRIEPRAAAPPYFHGEAPSLVDATWAPLLQRLGWLAELRGDILAADRHPRLLAWRRALLATRAVQCSHVPDLRDRYRAQLAKRRGWIASRLDPELRENPGPASVY